MFTGIVETVGRVREVSASDGLRRLVLAVDPTFLEDLEPGDSVSVDGACLTAVEVVADGFRVDVIASTLGRTVAARYRPGVHVNLERAVAVGERLEGHIVQGHVDGVGNLIRNRREGDTRFLELSIPPEVHAATILHGSIALNGVSLTVNRLLGEDRIEVALIPHTWTRTNLSELAPGDPVNVEGDLIGKYVGRLLEGSRSRRARGGEGNGGHASGGLSPDRLRELGT